jgi:DNA-binding winged helix-turn-helix (wHTH) protein/tetratricopeptide (TPR) repeat protein
MANTDAIRLPDVPRFTVAGVTVTPAARTLAAAGRMSVIEPRVMQVLVTLHRQYGEVVGREALIDACWDGRTVGEDSINRAILKLRRALYEIGGDLKVETVAKVGYLLRAVEPASAVDPLHTPPVRSRRRWVSVAIAGVTAAVAAAGILLAGSRQVPPSSRTIVVQSLRAAANDVPAQRLSQDFTSDLSRAVLGHDGRLEFAEAAGKSTGDVAFNLAGNVASIGSDLHAVVTISQRGDPAIAWSHDYTAPLADAEGLRRQVSTNVAAVLVCALGADGVPDQIDVQTAALYLEACTLHSGDHRREIDLLRQVIARAPNFAGAWADLAISLTFLSADAAGDDVVSERREAQADATHALSLDPHEGRAYYARALLLPGINNWTARERTIDAGLAAQPDCPPLYSIRANNLAAIGRLQDSIASNRRSVALDPLFPGKTASLARSLAAAGQQAEADDVVRHMREVWPDDRYTWVTGFEIAARSGDPHEAEAILDRMHGRFFSAGEIGAWRTFLRAREAPTESNVQNAIKALLNDRRQGATSDAELVEDFTLLGHPEMAVDLAIRLPPQPDSQFWFRSDLQPLRADPRFMAIAERQGLYAIWRTTAMWPDFCTNRSLPYDCRRPLSASRTVPQS